MTTTALTKLRRAGADPLYRNSAFLVGATLINSAGGFLFWQLCARLLPADRVGVGTSLVSAAVLAANIGLAGMNNSVIRYVPAWDDPRETIAGGLTVVVTFTAVVAGVFVLAGSHVTRSLSTLARPTHAVVFMAFSVVLAVNLYADQVFVALRSTGPVLSRTALVNITRLGLPLLLLSALGVAGGFGVFSAYSLGAATAAATYVVILRRRFGISTSMGWPRRRLSAMWRFSAGTYLSVLLSSLPMLIMPVLVAQRLRPADAAYFFVAFMLSAVVAVIPQATTRSLFAEGSADGPGLGGALRRALRATAAAQLAAMVVVLAGGDLVLGLFGPDYKRAYPLLVLLCLATVFGAVNQIGSTLLALQGRLRDLCLTSGTFCVVVIGSSWMGLAHGLSFAGVAWIAGEGTCSVMYVRVIRGVLGDRPQVLPAPPVVEVGASTRGQQP